jgi:hypothetical protein
MTVSPKIQPVLYALGVFIVFSTLVAIMKLVTHTSPDNADYFGLYTNKDLLLGAAVAAVLTFSHVRKKKLK